MTPKCALLLPVLLLASAAGVAEEPASVYDPWEPFNRKMYAVNDTLDRWVLKPTAEGYHYVMPYAAQQGVTNFIANVYDFNSFFNSVLQGEFTGSLYAGSRFLINSTLGLLGLVDVASEMGIEPFNSDFGQTLAVWGVGSGPFVMLPVIAQRRRLLGRYLRLHPVTAERKAHCLDVLDGGNHRLPGAPAGRRGPDDRRPLHFSARCLPAAPRVFRQARQGR